MRDESIDNSIHAEKAACGRSDKDNLIEKLHVSKSPTVHLAHHAAEVCQMHNSEDPSKGENKGQDDS
jgi:hypothetical protein